MRTTTLKASAFQSGKAREQFKRRRTAAPAKPVKHKFIHLASVPIDGSDDPDVWWWCTMCGCLRIGDSYFAPGAGQGGSTKTIMCAITTPLCHPSTAFKESR